MNKNTTLFGGKNIIAHFEPLPCGTAVPDETVKVRQIPVREYESGFLLVNNEPALVGFLCGKPKAWALTLSPDSFEELLAVGQEVNERGFFSFCQRRMEHAAQEQADMIGMMAKLPEETMNLIMERGRTAQAKLSSPILSPEFVSPPAR